MGNGSFGQGHLADADLLWPGGLVEYKFYRTFPRWSDSLTRIEMLSWSFQETPAKSLEGDELHQQQNLLHQVWASRHIESKLCDNCSRSFFINNVTTIATNSSSFTQNFQAVSAQVSLGCEVGSSGCSWTRAVSTTVSSSRFTSSSTCSALCMSTIGQHCW